MKLPESLAGAAINELSSCIVFLLPIVNIYAAWNFSVSEADGDALEFRDPVGDR